MYWEIIVLCLFLCLCFVNTKWILTLGKDIDLVAEKALECIDKIFYF